MNALAVAFLIAFVEAPWGSISATTQGEPVLSQSPGGLVLSPNLTWPNEAFRNPAKWHALVLWASQYAREVTGQTAGAIRRKIGAANLQLDCFQNVSCAGILGFEEMRGEFNARTFEKTRLRVQDFGLATRAINESYRPLLHSKFPRSDAEELALLVARSNSLRTIYGMFLFPNYDLSLDKKSKDLAILEVRLEIRASDIEATEFLKRWVFNHGWPTKKRDGTSFVEDAWLVAQHSDLDPLFQLRALELIQAQSKSDGPNGDYAYLFDRIHLRFLGSQRYGTQLSCQDHKFVPLQLEMPKSLDQRRLEAGLPAIKTAIQAMGPC